MMTYEAQTLFRSIRRLTDKRMGTFVLGPSQKGTPKLI